MSYGGHPYGDGGYGGNDVAAIPQTDTKPALAVEMSLATDPLATPVWVDVTPDVRAWSTARGRRRELERHPPGRATVVLANRERQYDSTHTANVKPMKRIRIRETFNGTTYPVFDGFVDKWQLSYPGTGKDATATVTATDGFKVLARAELPVSVYADEVAADTPAIWWRLDDPQFLFSAVDASGNGRTGTPQGDVSFEEPTLIAKDPGSGIRFRVVGDTNVEAALALTAANPFSFEFWAKLDVQTTGARLAHFTSAGSAFLTFAISTSNFRGTFTYQNDAAGSFSAQPNFTFTQGQIYHIVCTHDANRLLHVYINGVEHAYITQNTTSGATTITAAAAGSSDSTVVAGAVVDEFAVYTSALSAARVAVHYAAGNAPWSGDLPGARIGRALDEAGWPSGLRSIDAGITTFQATPLNTTALEHIQVAAESEYGSLLFMTRDGLVGFRGRTAVLAREPLFTFGDAAGEIGYTWFVPDDGDETIRNRAVISRLDGVAKTSEDTASIAAFGRFDFVLEGLMHSTEAVSADYAAFVTDNYGDPRRRIASLDLGDAVTGQEAALFPAMLGLELGDAVTVKNTPLGGGSRFTQICAVEGIEHESSPGGPRTCRLLLSPDYA